MPDLITLFQTWIANWSTDVGSLLPVGYALGAGMVFTVNPCGFAMLPAYLSLYPGTGEEAFVQHSPILRTADAIYISSIVTLGFVVLVGLVGLRIAAGGQFLMKPMPRAGLATGVALAAIGVMLLSGKHLYSGLSPGWRHV